jgi:hypothetical protein
MNRDIEAADSAITGSGEMPKSDFLRWARSSDLATQARAFHLAWNAWERITPRLTLDEQCDVIADSLLTCLAQNPTPDDADDFIQSGFEAGHTLAFWLKHLSRVPEAVHIIEHVVERLEQLYRESDARGRNRIETGALEHIFEAPSLRGYFDSWANDVELRPAYESAIAWGRAHSDDAH